MPLILNTDLALYEVRDAFANCYPGLRLFFFFDGDENLQLSTPLFHSFSFSKVKELYPGPIASILEIDESSNIKETEELFEKNWNLPARIYAASEGYWQRSRSTANRLIGEFRDCPYLVNKEDFSVCPGS